MASDDNHRVDGESTGLASEGGDPQGRTVAGWTPSRASKPQTIGPYTIVKLLGSGGMGSVYLAEQERPIRRRVAIKLIRATIATEHMVRRFEAERQALAMMQHPVIARVYEAGTTEIGEPYFAMELVEGLPITIFCDQNRLSVRERLELLCAVCEGVQHAHQKGIIHRDLKPSNVLVENHGSMTPKIIDFGIAKALDQPLTGATLITGERLLGTPAYMSPERLLGEADIDTRADVYSLGVMLYELLTGRLPFDWDRTNVVERIKQATTLSPQVPSTKVGTYDGDQLTRIAAERGADPAELPRRLRGDLDWITLKAIAPERDRRYGSAAELVADIRRHLGHEPVLASPPSVTYRVGKFVRRHRLAVAMSALVALALIGGMVTTSLQARRASREAEAMRRVTDFMVGLFQVSNPTEARGETVTAREILDRGVLQIESELEDQPVLRARLLGTMGTVYVSLGLYEDGAELLEEALVIIERELGPDHPVVADTVEPLARVRLAMGSPEDAERLASRALTIRQIAFGVDHRLAARSLTMLALAVETGGGEAEAEADELFRRALAVQRRNGDAKDIAATLTAMANSSLRRNRLEEAEELYQEAVRVTTDASGRSDPTVGHLLGNIGLARYRQRRYENAEAAFLEGIAIIERALPPEHPDLATSLFPLGEMYAETGRLEDAERVLDRACAIRRSWMPLDHPLLVETIGATVEVKARLGKVDEAETLMSSELDRIEAGLGPDHVNTGKAEAGLGYLLFTQGRYQEAEALMRAALEVFDHTEGGEVIEWHTLGALAMLMHMTGRPAEGEAFATRAGELADRMAAISQGN